VSQTPGYLANGGTLSKKFDGAILDAVMTPMIAMLRAVNVGGTAIIKMERLRKVCEEMGLERVRTYIQSGNIVFRSPYRDTRKRLEAAIVQEFGVKTEVILRTVEEMRGAIENSPFGEVDPKKLLVTFLVDEPTAEAVAAVMAIEVGPEEVHIIGREMFIYFPDGMGKSKLPIVKFGRLLKTPGTGRNWNTVQTLMRMVEE